MFEMMQEHFEEDEMDMLEELTDIYSSSGITLEMFMNFIGLTDRNEAYNTVISNVDFSKIIQWDYATETIEMTIDGFLDACMAIDFSKGYIVAKFIVALMFKGILTPTNQ